MRPARSVLLACVVAALAAPVPHAHAAPPSNDAFADAAPIDAAVPASASGTNVEATVEPGEPGHAGAAGGHSVWWRWTAPVSGAVEVHTCGSDFDTTLAVYTGDSVDALTGVAGNDDGCDLQSKLLFNASAGQTYHLAVDGYQGATGSIDLAIQPPPQIYLALGDSVSTGYGLPPGEGFVERYYAYLQDPANGALDELYNLARDGETSSSMRTPGQQLDSAVALIGGPSDTKVVTLDIGGNDGAGGSCPSGFNTPPCPFADNYRAIVQTLQTALADDPGQETFQVMQYYNPASGQGSSTEGLFDYGLLGSDAKVDCSGSGGAIGLNDLVACIGREHGAAAVDAYPTFKANGQSLMADRLHPNATGHAYLACLFEHPDRAGSSNPCQPTPPQPEPVADVTAPRVTLAARARQRALRQRGLIVFVLPDEDAVVNASARIAIPAPRGRGRSSARVKVVRLGPLTKSVTAGARIRLKLRLSRKGLRLVRKALLTRRSLPASLTVRAADAAGNSRTTIRRVKVVR